MAITQEIQIIRDYPKLGDTHEIFRQKADICWTDLATAIPQINVWGEQVNTLANDITTKTNLVTDKTQIIEDNLIAIDTVSSNIYNVNQVGNNVENVNTTGQNINAVVTTAQNITDVNNYSKTYLGPKTDEPITRNDGSDLQVGDLYFDTNAKEMRAWSENSWVSVNPITYSKAEIDSMFNDITTETPSITIGDSVNENSNITGTYTCCSDCDIYVDALKGTISIDKINKQFTYKAYDITSGQDETDTITVFAIAPGKVESAKTEFTINVIYVPMVADEALIDNDLQANMYPDVEPDGFKFI